MDISDRFLRGFLAGVGGGIAQNAIDFAFRYGLQIPKKLYLDWTAVLLYGDKSNYTLDTVFSVIIHLFFDGFLGIAFAYFIIKVTSKNYLFKGWLYAIFMWFSFELIPLLFKVEPLIKDTFKTEVLTFVGASVYGLVLAKLLQWFDRMVEE